jgi:hypothetical protein
MVLNPRYRSAGLLGMPYFVFVEALAPPLEVFGICLIAIGFATGQLGIATLELLAFVYMVGVAISILTLLFDEIAYHSYEGTRDRMRLCVYAILEQLFFRPLNLVWRCWGLVTALRRRHDWGDMVRTGTTSA